jgi:hypothetical protein
LIDAEAPSAGRSAPDTEDETGGPAPKARRSWPRRWLRRAGLAVVALARDRGLLGQSSL